VCGISTVKGPRSVAVPVAETTENAWVGPSGVVVCDPSKVPLKGTLAALGIGETEAPMLAPWPAAELVVRLSPRNDEGPAGEPPSVQPTHSRAVNRAEIADTPLMGPPSSMSRRAENGTYSFGVNCAANGSRGALRRAPLRRRLGPLQADRGRSRCAWCPVVAPIHRIRQGHVSEVALPLSAPSDITQLLRQWSDGDQEALNRLVPLVYAELRRLAHQRLRRESANRSVNTTGLVHDAYMKLMDVRQARFRDRAHFLAMASRVMRRLLIDQARARRAAKRGSGADTVELDEALYLSEPQADALTELDDALQRLEALDPRQGQIVEQRYFGGLSLEETAEALGVSLATVKRELRFAHAWLAAELGPTDTASGKSA